MQSSIPYSLAFVGIILTASLAVLGQDDPCFNKNGCEECVATKINTTAGNNGTCIFEWARDGPRCVNKASITEGVISVIYVKDGCHVPPPTSTPPPSTTSTTAAPGPTTNATTTSTTTAPASTNGTTTSAPTPTTNGTTTAPSTTVAPTTNGTTTVSPSTNGTTTTVAPTPTPAPKKGGFAWGEFIGGIVFAVALSSLAYLIWRFYKARLDRNYHTFSNPTF